MKILLVVTLIFLSVYCKDGNRIVKINFPTESKILYWEIDKFQEKRVILFSIKEQKEYEIPVEIIDRFPTSAKFSPDGTKILLKDPNNTDGIHIFDLVNSEWNHRVLFPLNVPGERGELYEYDYLDDTTVVFNGLNNLFIISLNTNSLLDHIEDGDNFFIRGIDVNPNNNLLFLNYSASNISLNSFDLNTIQYDYRTHDYSSNFNHTGKLYQWIPETEWLFMLDSTAVIFNYKTGKKESINFGGNTSINFPSSKFINSRKMILLKKSNENTSNNFYLFDIIDKSIVQITKTNTEKSTLDIFYN